MECPHLEDNVKTEILMQDANKTDNGILKYCATCRSENSPWLCLACCTVHCGRVVNRHALLHSEMEKNHCVCMDLGDNYAVYCYSCDDYVINDTQTCEIERVRGFLRENLIKEKDPLCIDDEIQDLQRSPRSLRLRGRKRSHSHDSGNENVGKVKCFGRTRTRKAPLVGLRNLGNTCFMNSVLQSLSSIEEFCEYFKQLPALEKPNSNGRRVYHATRSLRDMNDEMIAEELRKVLISLDQGGSEEAISPNELFAAIWKVVPRFRGYQQQDAHEFLRYMLDRLHTELLGLLPDETLRDSPYISLDHKGRSSIVTSVFGGMLQSEVRCLHCTAVSKKHDPFLDLSLDIPDKFLYNQRKGKETEDNGPPCTIFDCLTSFIDIEELADTELYYCNNCKSKQRSTKRFWIRRLPNVLCLHLKRFRWSTHLRTKINVEVEFPTNALDMSQFVLSSLPETRQSGTGTNLYDLAAVIVHHGSGSGSGHYTAYAINDGEWFHFNDSSVRVTQADKVSKSKPYILFYVRREFSLPKVNNS